ncbi:MAG: uncharacterized protein A8A55_1653 [Amphiamblys sp. WSBS2006]|nr:MAG: uncharacterized protein A8A55_1653 [Amphiamblys sp. WSBS2006]
MPIENTVEPPQATPPKKKSKMLKNASQAPPPKKKSKSPENAPQAKKHYKRQVAVIALPVLVSRFSVVEFDLDEKGNITNLTIAAGKNVIWKEADKSLRRKLQDIWNSSFTAAKKHNNEEAATKIADNTVESLIKKKREEQQKLVEIGGFVLVPEKKAARDFANYASRCLVGINPTETPVNK